MLGWSRYLSIFTLTTHVDGGNPVDCTIRLWDAKTESCQKELKEHRGPIKCITYSPQGYVSCFNQMTVRSLPAVWTRQYDSGILGTAFAGRHYKDMTNRLTTLYFHLEGTASSLPAFTVRCGYGMCAQAHAVIHYRDTAVGCISSNARRMATRLLQPAGTRQSSCGMWNQEPTFKR
ncbi:MAG: hypothetical protein J3Q66DRAFT_97877 [Benniella sp.]|nr:MAG: hypothetical protein J3Q66DRAFT_97877 [Benniella sp.]